MSLEPITIPPQLLTKIQQGNVAIFIGAGASIPAGLPSGSDLSNRLKIAFSECDKNINDFMDLCQDILETPGYDRQELENVIRSNLSPFDITETHKILTRYDWSAIFTTNFDTVIETAYNTAQSRMKSCTAISKEKFSVNLSDRSKVSLFKMMGSVDGDDESSMVLSRQDYMNSIRKRAKYFQLLSDYVKSGAIIYLGYSFRDRIALDIIGEVANAFGIDRLPWSYMVDPFFEENKKWDYIRNSNKIFPIKCSVEVFFEALAKSTRQNEYIYPIIAKPKAVINILGREILFPEEKYRMYLSSFSFLYEELINQTCNVEEFLKGKSNCWHAYKNRWDFVRLAENVLDQKLGIESAIRKEYNDRKNRILFLHGMPGCGKTILSNRIAYNYYKDSVGPVMFIDKGKNVDFKIVAEFIEDVNGQFDKSLNDNDKGKVIVPLIIFDDASNNLKDILRLKEFLDSRGRTAIILVNGRSNELITQFQNFKIPETDRFNLLERFTLDEIEKIIDYLYDFGFIKSKNEKWRSQILNEYQSSVFATFYSFVDPSKKPLNEIIKDQFNKLPTEAQRAFLVICCFSQFNIYINLELLVRSVGINWSDYAKLANNLEKIVFEEIDIHGNILFRAHHKIIAQRTIEYFVDQSNQLDFYKSILANSLLHNVIEKDIIEEFLISNFGKDVNSPFTIIEKGELFRIVCESDSTRSLSHHWGLIQIEEGLLEDAEKQLKLALELPREQSEKFRGESDQNILTSLGVLNSKAGIQEFKQGKKKEANERLEIAEKYFSEAKLGEFPNAYAYHANANMWYQKIKIEVSQNESENSSESFSKCLSILQAGIDNVNRQEAIWLLELESVIWANFNDEKFLQIQAERIQRDFNSPSGRHVYASFFYHKAISSAIYKEMYLDRCLDELAKGLSDFPLDDKCLTLKCKAMLLKGANSDEEMFDALEMWYNNGGRSDNAQLLFHFGRLAFIIEEYDLSEEVFDELENGIGLGNENRSRQKEEIVDKTTGKPKLFKGRVKNIYSKTDGSIKITSLSKSIYIGFRPVSAKFTIYHDAPVYFTIAFNFRGPFATNVIKEI